MTGAKGIGERKIHETSPSRETVTIRNHQFESGRQRIAKIQSQKKTGQTQKGINTGHESLHIEVSRAIWKRQEAGVGFKYQTQVKQSKANTVAGRHKNNRTQSPHQTELNTNDTIIQELQNTYKVQILTKSCWQMVLFIFSQWPTIKNLIHQGLKNKKNEHQFLW